jgi:hypothetical protein
MKMEEESMMTTTLGKQFGIGTSSSSSFLAQYEQDMDAIRLNELYQLPPTERERIQEEIHGVKSMAVEETPELLQVSFCKFDAHVQTLTTQPHKKWQPEHAAYHYAVGHSQDCQYVLTNRNFHLMFLRAELFDVPAAAVRYLKNLAILYRYFGYQALQRPLHFHQDLTRAEQTELKTGKMQILPSRDRSGRLISVILEAFACEIEAAVGGGFDQTGGAYHKKNLLFGFLLLLLLSCVFQVFSLSLAHSQALTVLCFIKIRIIVFIVNTAYRNDTLTQQLGAVTLWSGDPRMAEQFQGFNKTLADIMHSDPIRYSAIHICLPSGPLYNFIRAAIFMNVLATGRSRSMVHEGKECPFMLQQLGGSRHAFASLTFCLPFLEITNVQCSYSLMSFGIPVQQLPITSTGNIKTKPVLKWLKAVAEQDKNPNAIIIYPHVNDILFSKGGAASHHHYGNIEFKACLEAHIRAFQTPSMSSYQRIPLVCQEIVNSILSSGGRLLSLHKDGAWWEEITDPAEQTSRVKVAWYDHIKRMNARKKQQASTSDTMQFMSMSSGGGGGGLRGCNSNANGGGCCSSW